MAASGSLCAAEIVHDSYWADNHDFVNQQVGVRVVDGIVQGTDDALTQRIQSTWTRPGHPADYLSLPNVQRVAAVLSEERFNSWMPNRHANFTYDAFLRAVAKFPAFCHE